MVVRLGLLQEGGMSYQRARKLTKRLCRVIQDCRAAIAKQRNERQRQATKEKRAMAAAEMAQVIAGRQVRQRRGDDGGGDSAGGARRHQEGAVEARGSLGGGGKRGVRE